MGSILTAVCLCSRGDTSIFLVELSSGGFAPGGDKVLSCWHRLSPEREALERAQRLGLLRNKGDASGVGDRCQVAERALCGRSV